jgi:CDP-glucose 4,6-dehydratase
MINPRFWNQRPVLVTGATGLLGSWVVKALAEASADIVCLVRDWVPQSELVRTGMLERIKVIRGEVTNQSLLERVLGEYEIDTVFHTAAQTIVGVANHNPVSTFQSNIAGTWSMLEACRRSPAVRQVIVASSDKAYGEQDALPYIESMPLMGAYPYDVSKSCADLIARCYALTWRLPVVITRCGNLFGGGDLNWNRLIPGTIRSVLHDAPPVIRCDGQYIRDYFYVEDAAEAYALLAEQLSQDRSLAGEAFNFSIEARLTVLEVVQMVLRATGSDLRPDIRNQASNEIRYQCLSSAKARKILSWKPVYGMEEGLRRTVAWYSEYFRQPVSTWKPEHAAIFQLRAMATDHD